MMPLLCFSYWTSPSHLHPVTFLLQLLHRYDLMNLSLSFRTYRQTWKCLLPSLISSPVVSANLCSPGPWVRRTDRGWWRLGCAWIHWPTSLALLQSVHIECRYVALFQVRMSATTILTLMMVCLLLSLKCFECRLCQLTGSICKPLPQVVPKLGPNSASLLWWSTSCSVLPSRKTSLFQLSCRENLSLETSNDAMCLMSRSVFRLEWIAWLWNFLLSFW